MKSLSFLKKPLYSALTFFGTLIVLTVGYATLSTGLTTSDRVNTGSGLTSSSWNRIVNGVLELDTRTTSISASGGNVGIGTTSPNAALEVNGQRIRVTNGTDPGIELSNGSAVKGYLFYSTSGDYIGLRHASANPQLALSSNGNVGIGTASPWAALTVTKNSSNGWDNGIQLLDQSGSNAWYMHSDTNGNFMIGRPGLIAMFINPSSNATFVGTVTANGVLLSSDRNLKKNIETLSGGLDKILSIRWVTYNWKDPSKGTGSQDGVIAQEVEKVLPELVSTNEKGVKAVNYAGLTAPLIEAIKEQQKQIATLQAKVQSLEDRQ